MGPAYVPFDIRNGDPADLDVLFTWYPKMKIIAAHLGKGYEDLVMALMWYKTPAMYTDLAGSQYDARLSPWHLLMRIRHMMDMRPNALLMASDWPFIANTPPIPNHKEWFDFIRNLKLPEVALQLGMKDFTQEEKDKILGENARVLLKL